MVYDELLESLGMPNVKLALEALTLINWLIVSAPSKRKRSKLLASFESLGLYEELRKLGQSANDQEDVLKDKIIE